MRDIWIGCIAPSSSPSAPLKNPVQIFPHGFLSDPRITCLRTKNDQKLPNFCRIRSANKLWYHTFFLFFFPYLNLTIYGIFRRGPQIITCLPSSFSENHSKNGVPSKEVHSVGTSKNRHLAEDQKPNPRRTKNRHLAED